MKVALLSVPFTFPQYAGLGLTQIKGRLKQIFKENFEVKQVYSNHDFYRCFGDRLYQLIGRNFFAPLMNEWIFRLEAFGNIQSNHEEYFRLFRPGLSFDSPEMTDLKEKFLNLGDYIRQVISKYRLTSYDVIGVNATFEILPGLAFCRHLKQIHPGLITVMGGAAVSPDVAETLIRNFPYLDYACAGSGLVSFPKLIRAIMENDEIAANSIDGMFSRNNTGKIKGISEDLSINEDIPLDYDDFFESFRQPGLAPNIQPVILMETSRGCWWGKCTFCGFNKEQSKYRAKRPEKAVAEINRCFHKYGCSIGMVDNIMPRHYVKKVLPYIRTPEGKFLMYETRSDYNEEEMKALNRARVKMIQPGIESLSTPVLEVMEKGTDAFQSINMLKLCVKYGILPGWYLLVGLPGMTAGMYESLLAVIPRLLHFFPPEKLNPLRIDRYSIYWKNSEKYNLVPVPFTAYEYVYPYDKDILTKIAYHFEDRNYDTGRYYLLSKYYKELEDAVNNWILRWHIKDIRRFPRLTFYEKEDGIHLYDSRRGNAEEYKISSLEAEILTILDAPHPVDDLVTRFPGETTERIRGVLRRLDDKGLVFEENDRYMSLVIRDYREEEVKFIVEACDYQVRWGQ